MTLDREFRYLDRWQFIGQPDRPLDRSDRARLEQRDIELEDYLRTIFNDITATRDSTSWIPQLTATTTNPTLGTGSIQGGWWKRLGSTVWGEGQITFGTAGTAAGSGNYNVDLPFNALLAPSPMTVSIIGECWLNDASVPVVKIGVLRLIAADQVRLVYEGGVSTGATNAAPWGWTISDSIFYRFRYEAA